ncbi:MAG: DDE-type integrase/transposase/recombinase [Rhodocyclaceae bacterium]|nr:DDE-type integrase/transposase/recombinase [Rhodocyclaceae bacterium]
MKSRTEQIVALADELRRAAHGARGEIKRRACAQMGISLATLHRLLRAHTAQPARKTRADKGSVCINRDDARKIAALVMAGVRQNGKQTMTIDRAWRTLTRAGEINEIVDVETGAIITPSRATLVRALEQYGLHPRQLMRPAAHTQLRSLHPNHCWQIDASVCVLFYLPRGGMRVMDERQFNKNKPHNVAKIAQERVIRYVVTDHYSGAFRVLYTQGAETTAAAAEALIRAMEGGVPGLMHGRPTLLMADQGAPHKSAAFRTLLDCLGIELQLHAPGNARATGSVERTQNIVETEFESMLHLFPPHDIDDLNNKCERWLRYYHARAIHSRHKRTRTSMWSSISGEQLVEIDGQLARELLAGEPQERKVSGEYTVRFGGEQYNVKQLPGVHVGETLQVAVNPLRTNTLLILDRGADGRRVVFHAPVVECDAVSQYRLDAPIVGQQFARLPLSVADSARESVAAAAERTTTGEAPAPMFGGRVSASAVFPVETLPVPLPRRGETFSPAVEVAAPTQVYSHFRAAQWLIARGVALSDAVHTLIDREWPDGVPETDLEELQRRAQTASGLQIVKGGER